MSALPFWGYLPAPSSLRRCVGVEPKGGSRRRLGDKGGAVSREKLRFRGVGRSEGAVLDARPATNQEARHAFKLLQPREPAPGMVSAEGLGRGRRLGAESALKLLAQPAGGP